MEEYRRRRYPFGCEVDGIDYEHHYRKGVLYCAPGHKPGMRQTIALFAASWPKVRRIVVKSGNAPCINYVCRGPSPGEWEALRPGHPGYVY